jgi:hypothetical protein
MAKLHDGYYLNKDGNVIFYEEPPLIRIMNSVPFRVDREKVLEFEALCVQMRSEFTELGQLRLHTPVAVHQEKQGTLKK